MISFEHYVRPSSPEEAYELALSPKNIVGGGMMWLHLSEIAYDTFIDLCDLHLDEIREEEECFRIGSMVSLSALENYEPFTRYFGTAFRDALKHIVGVQFRNSATIGGSVCARLGFSDVITLLLVLDAELQFHKQGSLSLKDFISRPNAKDILLEVRIPKKKMSVRYESIRRTYTDIPVLTVCAVRKDDSLSFSVGSRPGIAKLYGVEVVPEFGSNPRGSKEYREQVFTVLKQRILKEMEEER